MIFRNQKITIGKMRASGVRRLLICCAPPKSDFRFPPESGLRADLSPCPFGANNRLVHRAAVSRFRPARDASCRDRALPDLFQGRPDL